MKIIYSLCLLGLFAVSCTSKNAATEDNSVSTDKVTATAVSSDSLSAGADTGAMQHLVYSGLLPAASGSGIEYTLSVDAPENSGDGTFELVMNYKGADNGKDESFTYKGKRFTQRGIPGDNDATVWQCVSADGNDTFNFLKEGDDKLVLLNDKFEKAESPLNYTLTLVK